MPTRTEWENALSSLRQITVTSSASLITEIRSRQAQRLANLALKNKPAIAMKQNLQVASQFDPSLDCNIRVLDLLHATSRVTSPLIPNLADINSTWAVARYIWAFHPSATRTKLRLSDEARRLDFHQKTLLSDQLGVGMAAYLMESFFSLGNSIDVDVALRSTTWRTLIRRSGKTCPDYLFYDNSNSNLHLVECKGNQTSQNSAFDQLRRGTEQLPSISLTTGGLPGLVIGTFFDRRATTVFVIDPPGEDEPLDKKEKATPKSKKIDNHWKIENESLFFKDLTKYKAIKYFSFAGAAEPILGKLDHPHLRANIPELSVRETETGVYKGTSFSMTQADTRISFFRGVQGQILRAAASADEEELAETLSGFERAESPYKFEVSEGQGGAMSFKSISKEGTMFEVTLGRRHAS